MRVSRDRKINDQPTLSLLRIISSRLHAMCSLGEIEVGSVNKVGPNLLDAGGSGQPRLFPPPSERDSHQTSKDRVFDLN